MSAPPPGFAIAPVLAGVVAGAALQLQQSALWPLPAYGAVATAGAALLWLLLRWPLPLRLRSAGIFLASVFLFGAITGLRAATFAASALPASLEGRDLALTGLVAALPQRNEDGVRFRFEVEAATDRGIAVRLPKQVLLGWYGGVEARGDGTSDPQRQMPPPLQPGERWHFTARLKAPHGHVNPHGFDYELWLWEQGVQATGYVRTGPRDPAPRRLAQTAWHPIEQARARARAAIFARVADPRWAGVLAALVLGDQGAIERADWDVFRATGVAHLMSISGLHVTMFGWLAAAGVAALWRRSARLCLAWPAQHAALAGGVLVAAGYALFAGWGVPAQRTVCMMAAVALLRLSARDWPWPWVWLLACAAVVLVDPWALTQAGFWLSFVAVGVLFATGRAEPVQRRCAAARMLHAGRTLLREQGVVTVALTPLSVLLFGQVSLVGLLANLLAIPWVTLVVTPLGLAGLAWPALWDAAAAAVQLQAALLEVLAGWPAASWSAPAPPLWAGIAGVAGGLLLAMRLPPPLRALGLPLLLPVLLWQAPRPPPGEFELVAADVGQGNAVIVRTAAHTLVYDAGPGYSRETDAGQRVLVPLLRAAGDRVDLLVLSHRDSDHTGGAAAVLRMQPGAGLASSLEAGHPLHALRTPRRCEAGQAWTWDGVQFQVLHPAAGDYAAASRPNAVSCVLAVGNGRARVLLAGDVELAQERALLARAAPQLRADLLLVPHHGSRTSSSEAFLAAVAPSAALVQAGYRNRFGHPAADVVARLRARGIALFASPHCGAATWRSAQPAAVRCERERRPRYWRHRVAAANLSPN